MWGRRGYTRQAVTITQGQIDAGNPILNTATASSDEAGPATDDAVVTVELGSLDIFKYYDANQSGTYDAGDSPLANWQFTVSGMEGNFVTDTGGHVTVPNPTAGPHAVLENLKPGWLCTDPGQSRQKDVLVEPDATTDVMFGNHEGEHLVPAVDEWGFAILGIAFAGMLALFALRKRQTS